MLNHRGHREHRGKNLLHFLSWKGITMEKHYVEVPPGLNHLSHSVIKAAIEVHRALGPGFLENIYEEALAVELAERDIPFSRQFGVAINYKDRCVGEHRLDLWVENALVVEIKAVSELLPIHCAQVLSYLKALNRPLGLLINFNVSMLVDGVKRVISTAPAGALIPLEKSIKKEKI